MSGKVAIALGSNDGDAAGQVQAAFERLKGLLDGAVLSSLYESAPMYVTDQNRFVNAVAVGESFLIAMDLLRALKQMERDMGRVETFQNGPRLIDLDIVLFDSDVIEESELMVPHPRMAERPFVMVPLAELEPDWKHPVTGQTIQQMADALTYTESELRAVA